MTPNQQNCVFYVKNAKRRNESTKVRQYAGAREKTAVGDDNIRPELSAGAPGSAERIEALCAFYDMAMDTEESAFSL